jgi:hypothetical protein
MKEFAPGIPYHKGISEIPEKSNKVFEYAVQKHLADRAGLHYDVRLGDPKTGIGHSFVVRTMPKPGEKILAHHTIDHVIPYFDFTGKIKKGYGKGTVRRHSRGQVTIKSSSPDKITYLTHDKNPKKYSLIHTKDKKWLMLQSDFKKEAADLQTAKRLADDLITKHLRKHAYKIAVVGSISRNHDQVNDIDVVMWPKKSFKDYTDFIGQSGKKVIKSDYEGMPINIFLADKHSYEPTKMHFSLGKHIIRMKGDAKKKGMKLTRHGLFQGDTRLTGNEGRIKSLIKKI